MRRRATALALAQVALAAGGASAAQAGDAAPQLVRLSNERTTSTWAYSLARAPIYAGPTARARRVGRLQLETANGFPEVYLLMESRTDGDGESWVRLRVPGRPNGRTGWVARAALGSFEQTHWLIVVNLGARRLTAYFEGRVRLRAPVGVGKPSTPTPTGRFWVREKVPVRERASPYWPYVLGTSDYSTLTEWPGGGIVAIHGDFHEPRRIPGDPSHGCVRMRDSDIGWLGPRIPLGTPVEVIRG